MSSSLFLAKALVIAEQLRQIPAEVEKYNKECGAKPVGAEDGFTRLVLASPEVAQEIRKSYGFGDFRTRFAYPSSVSNFGQYPQLEIYNVEGAPLIHPLPVHMLSAATSNAVQVELLYVLLRSRGIHIPMW